MRSLIDHERMNPLRNHATFKLKASNSTMVDWSRFGHFLLLMGTQINDGTYQWIRMNIGRCLYMVWQKNRALVWLENGFTRCVFWDKKKWGRRWRGAGFKEKHTTVATYCIVIECFDCRIPLCVYLNSLSSVNPLRCDVIPLSKHWKDEQNAILNTEHKCWTIDLRKIINSFLVDMCSR